VLESEKTVCSGPGVR